MAPKKPRRVGRRRLTLGFFAWDDFSAQVTKRVPNPIKLQPAYPLAEAARILGTNPSTLRAWLHGRDYSTKGGPRRSVPVLHATHRPGAPLSFIDLVEAHMLLAIRKGYGIPLKNMRAAMDYLREQGGDLLFLAHQNFKHDCRHLYVKQDDRLLSLSERGQQVHPGVIADGLKQIIYGEDGYADRLFPRLKNQEQKTIMLAPTIGFGRPTLARLGVSVGAIAERFEAGEPMVDLAADYGATVSEIEDAIRWTTRHAA